MCLAWRRMVVGPLTWICSLIEAVSFPPSVALPALRSMILVDAPLAVRRLGACVHVPQPRGDVRVDRWVAALPPAYVRVRPNA
jgi:hypothetical protein